MIEVRIPSPVKAPPLEPTTPIKPSEALRLGRLSHPNRFDADGNTTYVSDTDHCACAIGAVAIGYGWTWDDWEMPDDYAAGLVGPALAREIEVRSEGWEDWSDNPQTDDQIVAYLESRGL